MAITKASLISDLTNAFNGVTSNSGALTEAERVTIYNKTLDVFKTVDPSKGTVVVKQVAVFE